MARRNLRAFRGRRQAWRSRNVRPIGAREDHGGMYVAPVKLSEYQASCRRTAVYPQVGDNLLYPTLGLCGEAGEVAEKIKKMIRDDAGVLTEERRSALSKELGDVLWYLAQLATEARLDLDVIAEANIEKLRSRQQRSVLQGSGDER